MQNKIFPEFWQKWSYYLPEEIKQPKLSARANKICVGMPVYSTSQGQTLFLRAKTRKNSSYNETGTRLRRLFKPRCAVQFKTLQKAASLPQSTGEQNLRWYATLFPKQNHFPVIFFLVNDSHFHYTLGMDISFKTKGVCAQMIHFTKNDDGTITNISFDGGCNGNLKAIAKLCDGMQADQIIKKLAGNTCGFKSTSCADQFAKALSEN